MVPDGAREEDIADSAASLQLQLASSTRVSHSMDSAHQAASRGAGLHHGRVLLRMPRNMARATKERI